MTRKRSSPMGLEIYLPVLLAFIMLPLLAQAAPYKDYTEIQQYTEGCYYNYNHYNEGDRIMTNEPCLNCTCHNKMLMCYLRVCPFTKPIGHDCIVEKREDQCCPIITCPEVPVDVAHAVAEPGTELSFPEKFGCSIDGKFYLEGAQVPSNPNKPCELCYCIKNRTSCLVQECTLHIDGCTPIYNKGSCCPVRYNCDHENDVLELEDHSSTTEAATTTTTERPTTGFIISSTSTPAFSTDCIHNNERYADGARIAGESACENCYCMRGDIVCAVQECHMPLLNGNGKLCHPMPAAEGECCPSNYVCKDDTATTQIIEATTLAYSGIDEEIEITTFGPVKDLHSAIPEEDLQLQAHIDDEQSVTQAPLTESETEEKATEVTGVGKPVGTTKTPLTEIETEKAPTEAAIIDEPVTTTTAPLAESETVEKAATESAIDDYTVSAESHEDHKGTEEKFATKETENAEVTTISSFEVKPTESDKFITPTSTSSDELLESTTKLSDGAQDESNTESGEKTDAKYPVEEEEKTESAEEGEKEHTTKVPLADDVLSKIPTIYADSDQVFATTTSGVGKSEIEESMAGVSEANAVDKQSTTELSSTENVFEESTKSAFDATGDDKESKPHKSVEFITESNKSVTEASILKEEEQTSTESVTKSTLVVATAQKEPSAGQQDDEFATEMSSISEEEEESSGDTADEIADKVPSHKEEEELFTSQPDEHELAFTEEGSGAEAQSPQKVLFEEHTVNTKEPNVERKPEDVKTKQEQAPITMMPTTSDEHDKSTEFTDENKTVDLSETSTESGKDKMITKVTEFGDEELQYVTTVPENEEEDKEFFTYKVPTKAPNYSDTVAASEEIEGSSEGMEKIRPISDDKQIHKPQEDHTIIPPSAEMESAFDDELGSGDFATEVISEKKSELSTVGPTIENVPAISQEKENTTDKPITSTEEKPIVQHTSSVESDESAESEEDNKLMNLTTAKPSESDTTETTAEISEEYGEHLAITTAKPLLVDFSSSAAEKSEKNSEVETVTKIILEDEIMTSTTASIKADGVNVSEDNIYITTLATLLDEKPFIVDQVSSDEHAETEVSSTPTVADEYEKTESSGKEDDTQKIFVEDITTEKPIEEHDQETSTTRVDIITETKEHDHKILPESVDHKDEEDTRVSDTSTPFTEEILSFTTSKPTAQKDIRTESNGELGEDQKVESSTIPEYTHDAKGDIEEGSASSTTKPFAEPTQMEGIPDMQLPSVIPGEGNCLVGQKTYENSSIVPSANECELTCRCISSLVICDHVKCDVPENVEKCVLDETSANKCCPLYICDTDVLPAMSEDSSESIEKDTDEEAQHTTVSQMVPTKPSLEKADTDAVTTTALQPTSGGISPGVSIPEIEMPVAMTEEPMSHVKAEDEFEQQTTKSSIINIAEDKKHIFIEGASSTTPAAVTEDNIVPQSMTPLDRHQEVASEKLPVESPKKEVEPEHPSSQYLPGKEFEEKTTVSNDVFETITDSAVYDPSKESELAANDENKTVKPIEEIYYEDKKTEPPTTTTAEAEFDDSSTEEAKTVPHVSFAEGTKKPEIQTDKPTSDKISEDTEPIQEPETQTTHTLASSMDEISSETPITFDETQKGIEAISTTPSQDNEFSTISIVTEQKQPSTEELSKGIYDSTTNTAIYKNQYTETNEEEKLLTTSMPSTDYFKEHEFSTTKQPSDAIKNSDMVSETLNKKLEDTSTIATIIEENFKETIKPNQEGLSDQSIELSTVVSETFDEASAESVTDVTDYNLEHTVFSISDDKHKKIPDESTPELETHTEEYKEKDKEPESQTTSAPTPDERTSVNISPSILVDSNINTEKPIDFETKIDDSFSSNSPIDKVDTTVPSYDNTEDMSTTIASELKNSNENKESTEDHYIHSSTYSSVEKQTESAEKIEYAGITKATDESIEEENITIPSIEQPNNEIEPSMAHTVGHLNEDKEFPNVSVVHEPQAGIDQSTTRPTAATEYSSEAVSSEKHVIPVEEDKIVTVPEVDKILESSSIAPSMPSEIKNTYVAVKQPHLDLSEEGSGESLESEEEMNTEPNLIHHTDEVVAQRVETTPKAPKMPVTVEEEEKESSGEEDEELEAVTDKKLVPIVKLDEHEVSDDELSEEDISSIVTKAYIADNESITPATTIPSEAVNDPETQKNYSIGYSTKAPTVEETTKHAIKQQSEKDIISLVTEGPISVDGFEHITAKQTETEEEISSEHVPEDVSSEEETEIENVQHITEDSVATTQEYESEHVTISAASGGADNQPEDQNITEVTKAADEIEKVDESTHDVIESEEKLMTELPEEKYAESSTIKTPLLGAEIQHVTGKSPTDSEEIDTVTVTQNIEEDDISAVTSSPNSLADKDVDTAQVLGEEESDEPKIVEITTARLPIDGTSEIIESHVPSIDAEYATYQQTGEVSTEGIDILSATDKPVKDINISTVKSSDQKQETFGATKLPESLDIESTTVKLPGHDEEIPDIIGFQVPSTGVKEESKEQDKITYDQTTQVPEIIQHEVSEHVTELPTVYDQSEEVFDKDITEMPEVAEVITAKIPDVMEQAPSKETELDKYASHEENNKVSVLMDVSTDKISEHYTESPTEDIKSDEDSHKNSTELSDETTLSDKHLPEIIEHITELATKHVESEVSGEKTTQLPTISHTFDELSDHDTDVPTKNIESEKEIHGDATESPVISEISTVKLTEEDMTIPAKDTHNEDDYSHEQFTELPNKDDGAIDNLPEHVTELPTKDIESEKESHEESTELSTEAAITTDKLLGHVVTKLPTESHEEDDKTEAHEHITELPENAHVSTEKLPEHITELPSKQVESEEDVNEPADKLPEHITEQLSKDGESEENSGEESTKLPLISESADKIPELPEKGSEIEEDSPERATELPVKITEVFTTGPTVELSTESAPSKEQLSKESTTEKSKDIGAVKLQPATTAHPLFSYHTTSPSLDSRIDDTTSHSTSAPAKEEESFTVSATSSVSTTTSEPVTTSSPHYQPQSPGYGQPPQYGPTQYEDEYTDEDEGEIFGPGTCRYGGKLYVSAQQIPRDDPCDFCFCFRSDIICLQQSCPPPISGCHEEPISGFCCPRYECPVSMATVLNITTSTTTTSTTLPPHFLHHSYGNNVQRNGCLINGRSYRVGEKIESTSGPCINCTCGGDGKMKCDPQACVPEPTMQQVMAVVAAGRKR